MDHVVQNGIQSNEYFAMVKMELRSVLKRDEKSLEKLVIEVNRNGFRF